MNDTPLVSVILPVYNGEKFIEGAFETLNNQDYDPLEIIVVDDGSTDNTADLVRKYPSANYVYQENAGPSVARNAGIRLAKADYIAFLDVDDQYPPGKIASQVQYLRDHPELEVVIGGIKYVYLDEDIIYPGYEPDDMRAFVNLGAGMFRRSVFDRIGMFAEDLRFSEDVDWFLNALEQDVKLAIVREPALIYRLHADSATHQEGLERMRFNFLKALRRSIVRRRRPDGSLAPLPDWIDYFVDLKPGEAAFPVWKDTSQS